MANYWISNNASHFGNASSFYVRNVTAGHGALDPQKKFYLCARVDSASGMLLKFDGSGTLLLDRYVKHPSFNIASGKVAIDASGNVAITGYTLATPYNSIIAKFNSSGTLQWSRAIPAPDLYINGIGIAGDSAGNFYVVGSQGQSPTIKGFILKYSGAGALLWQREVSTGANSTCYDAKIDSSDNLYVVVQHGNFSTLQKYNSSGTLQWQRQLSNANYVYGYGLAIDVSGSCFVAGYLGNGTDDDGFVAKYNSSGALQWQRVLSLPGGYEYAEDVAVDSSGNCYVYLVDSNYAYIVKYNNSGTIQWQRRLGQAYEYYLYTPSGGSIVADSSGSGALYVATAFNGLDGSYLFKLPMDGSGTFFLDLFKYEASSLTNAAGAMSDSAGALTVGAGSLTEGAVSLDVKNYLTMYI